MHYTGVNLGGFYSQVMDDIFTQEHLDDFITAEDIKRISGWGFNMVRLPVDYMFLTKGVKGGEIDENRLKRIDGVLKWCKDAGITMMLDLHKAPGHSFSSKEKHLNDLWDSGSESRKEFAGIWDVFSRRYKDSDNIIYEIMNEPVAPEASMWNFMAEEMIKVIRKNDTRHEIVVESNMWGQCRTFPELTVFNDDKIIYSFHLYEPILVTHQKAEWVPFVMNDIYVRNVDYPGSPPEFEGVEEKAGAVDPQFIIFLKGQNREWNITEMEKYIQPVLDFQKKNNVPVFCGEFGCIAKAAPETRKRWTADIMKIFKKHKISYTYWNYKNMDFGLMDFTEKYKGNPNYENPERMDYPIIETLKNGIL